MRIAAGVVVAIIMIVTVSSGLAGELGSLLIGKSYTFTVPTNVTATADGDRYAFTLEDGLDIEDSCRLQLIPCESLLSRTALLQSIEVQATMFSDAMKKSERVTNTVVGATNNVHLGIFEGIELDVIVEGIEKGAPYKLRNRYLGLIDGGSYWSGYAVFMDSLAASNNIGIVYEILKGAKRTTTNSLTSQ